MKLLLFLLVLLVVVIRSLKEPEMLKEIKRRYEVIRAGLPADERWKRIKNSNTIFTGTTHEVDGAGSNVNKGYEIYICLDGDDVNSAMYVVIHELAHMSVVEYDHSDKFWENFRDLKSICQTLGVYSPADQKAYCGQTVHT